MMREERNLMSESSKNIERRAFLGAAAGFMIVRPEQVRGSEANSAIRLGLIGCGGRGTAVATGFATNTNTRVVALADLFAGQLDKAKAHFDELAQKKGGPAIDPKLMFRGPKAYQELVSSGQIDMVQISTINYFHPEHLEAAVSAGKHVYCEKPVAVDVAGCKRVQRAGEKAKGRLSLDVGFQIRSAPPFAELVRRIHKGALGAIACASAHYYATAIEFPPRQNMSPGEVRIRNWYWDRVLSGDIMVDQNIHVIDICNWVLQNHPLKVTGACARKVRRDNGDCMDHFSVILHYPENVHVTFNSVQFGNKLWDVNERFFGSRGVSESPYSGPLRILGEEAWEWQQPGAKPAAEKGAFSVTGEFTDNLGQADEMKQKQFIESIVSRKYHNQAAIGAESALTAILARTAAYNDRELTWDELLKSDAAYDAGLDLNKLG
jgi:predicted dehydrogenase